MTRVFNVFIDAGNHASILGVPLGLFEAKAVQAYHFEVIGTTFSANSSSSADVSVTVLQGPLPGPVYDVALNYSYPGPALNVPAFPLASWDNTIPLALNRTIQFDVLSSSLERSLQIQFDSSSNFSGLSVGFEIRVTEISE